MPAVPHFRALKSLIRPWLKNANWSAAAPLPPETEPLPALYLVNPLFACLTEGGVMTDRAAWALGGLINRLHSDEPEAAKNVVRRFMWHMNEESGNIGWGIPEAFGQTLARCPALAEAFHRVLFSYIHNKEGDSSYCDYAPLRLSCYKAIGIVLDARPDMAPAVLPFLREGDPDAHCRVLAQELAARFQT